MKRIDEYVNNIYKGFDENDEETQILIEETTAHLYDEVEDLKQQGLSEEESIKQAILNFGKEKSVIKELKGILKKQDKFSKILLKIALIILFIGTALKLVFFLYDISGDMDRKDIEYKNNPNGSEYVFDKIEEKLNDKESIDDNLKNEIDEILDEFNNRNNNGLYHIYLTRGNDYLYEYSREISDDQIEKNGNGGSSGVGNEWRVQYRRTDEQCFYDYDEMDKAWESFEKFDLLNTLGNYLAVSSWIIACISFLYKINIKNKTNKKNIAYFSIASILVIGLMATGFHTFEEITSFLVFVLLIISYVYDKKYIEN